MITEDYCSYEVAKLLKEKGFDEKTLSYYEDNVLCRGDWFEWNRSPFGHIAAPTHQMAMKWLREVYNIYVDVSTSVIANDTIKYDFNIYYRKHKDNSMYSAIHVHKAFSKYEEAVEAALKYVLENLI